MFCFPSFPSLDQWKSGRGKGREGCRGGKSYSFAGEGEALSRREASYFIVGNQCREDGVVDLRVRGDAVRREELRP